MKAFEQLCSVAMTFDSLREPLDDEDREGQVLGREEHAAVGLRLQLPQHEVKRHEGLARARRRLDVKAALRRQTRVQLLALVRRQLVELQDRFFVPLRKVRSVDIDRCQRTGGVHAIFSRGVSQAIQDALAEEPLEKVVSQRVQEADVADADAEEDGARPIPSVDGDDRLLDAVRPRA